MRVSLPVDVSVLICKAGLYVCETAKLKQAQSLQEDDQREALEESMVKTETASLDHVHSTHR
jgi:hypothetical protein